MRGRSRYRSLTAIAERCGPSSSAARNEDALGSRAERIVTAISAYITAALSLHHRRLPAGTYEECGHCHGTGVRLSRAGFVVTFICRFCVGHGLVPHHC